MNDTIRRRTPAPGRTGLRAAIAAAAGLIFALAPAARAAEFPQGLVLHFGFDENSAISSVPDKSGRGSGGRGSGLTWTAAGKSAGAVEFAASNSYITVSHVPALSLTQQTVAAWFKTSRADAIERCLFEKDPAGGYALGIAAAGADGRNKGRLRFVVNGKECLGDASVSDGVWHHVAATCDGKQLKLYVDGQLQKQVVPLAGAFAANTNALTIGMNRTSPAPQAKGQSFEGMLDELMIFNHAISADQVQAVMDAAKPKFTKDQVRRRLAELQDLYDRGLILKDFYDRKVAECETAP